MAEGGLTCRQVSFQHPGGTRVLNRVEACFPAGEMALITGPTGIGKSTLLHLLGGLLSPTRGQILADEQPVSRWRLNHKAAWRRQVGFLFQHLHLIHEMTVLENVLLPLVPRSQTWRLAIQRAEGLLDRLGLQALARTRTGQLSGGQRQRTALARALVHTPRFLLMDEPSGFQDDAHTRHLLDLLAARACQGACVVVCSHDRRLMSEEKMFHRIWRLADGSIQPVQGIPPP